MEYVIEFTTIHSDSGNFHIDTNDGDYLYPDIRDVTIIADSREQAAAEFREQFPDGTFVKHYIDAIHLIPHTVNDKKYQVVLGDDNYLIKLVDNDELVAITLTETDAKLVCNALNQYHENNIAIENEINQQQLDLFDN